MHRFKLSIVIPCLNEKETIIGVINDVFLNAGKLFKNDYELIISDNGSTDGTIETLEKVPKIRIINTPIRGYGAALHWGILNSRGKYVLYADADGSYPFSNLNKFKKAIGLNSDLVLGSRMRGKIQDGAMPFLHRHLGTPFLTFLIRLLYKIPTSDCNSGMRMIKKSFYQTLNMRNSGMEWASELLLKTALNNGKYLEVPIYFKKDERNRKPHLSTWSDGWRHLKSIILLKPNLLILVMFVFLTLSTLLLNTSFGMASLCLLLFATTLFSYLALMFLNYAISGRSNLISGVLNVTFFVPITALVVIALLFVIYILPSQHLGSKMLLAGIISIIIIWLFMIETIKTHLVNRLPKTNSYD